MEYIDIIIIIDTTIIYKLINTIQITPDGWVEIINYLIHDMTLTAPLPLASGRLFKNDDVDD